VLADANAGLVVLRPLFRLTGNLKSVPGSVWGIDWDYGDKVSLTFDRRQFTAIIRLLTVEVENNAETLTVGMEAYVS
jgi:hypothetical protein